MISKMDYRGFVGQAEFDDQVNRFHGEIVNIRDVVTFQSALAKDLRKEFEASVEDYLAFLASRGEEPKPFMPPHDLQERI